MPDESSSWSWPVRWERAARLAAGRGQHPDVLLDDPDLVAHRVLDRLAAQALDVHQGAPGASEAFVDAIRGLVLGAPWLVGAADRPDSGAAVSGHAHDSHDACEGRSGGLATGNIEALPEDVLIDDIGISTLVAVAARLAGRDGATAIQELAATAMAAEQWLPGFSYTGDARDRADSSMLAGTFVAGSPRLATGAFHGSVSAQSAGERHSDTDPVSIALLPVWEHYELGMDVDPQHRLPAAFTELTRHLNSGIQRRVCLASC